MDGGTVGVGDWCGTVGVGDGWGTVGVGDGLGYRGERGWAQVGLVVGEGKDVVATAGVATEGGATE